MINVNYQHILIILIENLFQLQLGFPDEVIAVAQECKFKETGLFMEMRSACKTEFQSSGSEEAHDTIVCVCVCNFESMLCVVKVSRD